MPLILPSRGGERSLLPTENPCGIGETGANRPEPG